MCRVAISEQSSALPVRGAMRSKVWPMPRNWCACTNSSQENQIPFITLKGTVLAAQVYGNLALRHAGDIDLLVAPQHIELADKLLRIYLQRLLPNFLLTPSQHQRFVRLMHHFEYWQAQSNLSLELHWRAIHDQSPAALAVTQLLSRAQTVSLAGLPLPALSLYDIILYLCGHGGNHFWFRIFWLVDLAEIIRQNPAINWHQLITLADATACCRNWFWGLSWPIKSLLPPSPKPFKLRLGVLPWCLLGPGLLSLLALS